MMRGEDVDESSTRSCLLCAVQSYDLGRQEESTKESWEEGEWRHKEVGREEFGKK